MLLGKGWVLPGTWEAVLSAQQGRPGLCSRRERSLVAHRKGPVMLAGPVHHIGQLKLSCVSLAMAGKKQISGAVNQGPPWVGEELSVVVWLGLSVRNCTIARFSLCCQTSAGLELSIIQRGTLPLTTYIPTAWVYISKQNDINMSKRYLHSHVYCCTFHNN